MKDPKAEFSMADVLTEMELSLDLCGQELRSPDGSVRISGRADLDAMDRWAAKVQLELVRQSDREVRIPKQFSAKRGHREHRVLAQLAWLWAAGRRPRAKVLGDTLCVRGAWPSMSDWPKLSQFAAEMFLRAEEAWRRERLAQELDLVRKCLRQARRRGLDFEAVREIWDELTVEGVHAS